MVRARLSACLLSLLLLLGCAHNAPERSAPAKPPATAAEQAPPGLFLYALSREGRTSYLLGTIHLGFGFEEVLTPAARRAFDQADLVITETDVGSDASERLMRAALLPGDKSLPALLDAQSWRALEAKLGRQVPAQVLARMRPWLPAVLLSLLELGQILEELRPEGGKHAMDLELMELARRRGTSLQYLETMDEQIAVFTSISEEEQVNELRRALRAETPAESKALVSAFARGDEQALTRAVFDAGQLRSAPGFYKAVLFDRNERWVPQLTRAMQEKRAFIAVGVAHLLGERGLLATFAQRGYQISRVY